MLWTGNDESVLEYMRPGWIASIVPLSQPYLADKFEVGRYIHLGFCCLATVEIA